MLRLFHGVVTVFVEFPILALHPPNVAPMSVALPPFAFHFPGAVSLSLRISNGCTMLNH